MRRSRKRRSYKVSLVLPPGATVAMGREYIADAVGFLRGGLKPPGADDEDPAGDPMFDLDADTVKVSAIPTRRPVVAKRAK